MHIFLVPMRNKNKDIIGNVHLKVTNAIYEVSMIQSLINGASYIVDLGLEGKVLNFYYIKHCICKTYFRGMR